MPSTKHALPTLVLATGLVAALAACDGARPAAAPDAAADASSGGASSACTACHGDATRSEATTLLQAAPPKTATGASAGAHQAHLHDNAFRSAIACTECHVVPTSTGHFDGKVHVQLGALATMNGAAGTYAGGTCAVYCHGSTLGAGGAATTPTWTGGPVDCASCHGYPPPSHAASSTNCSSCHPGTVLPNGTINVAGGLHINGKIDVQAAHGPGWADPAQHGHAANRGISACTACHGTDFNGGSTGVSCNACHASAGQAAWQTNCTFCHGTPVASYTAASLVKAAPPAGSQGETATTARAVGAHQKHLAGGAIGNAVACTDCHSTLPTSLAHVTGTATVSFGAGATRGGAAPSWNGTGCAATYCHGGTLAAGGSNTAPVWTGGAAQAACGTCHGAPPPSHSPSSTACGSCHTGYTATTVNLATHINGQVDVANLSCTSCHGDATRGSNQAAPPRGTKGETATTTRAVGAHQAHLVAGPLSSAIACTECHVLPTSTSHSNGVVDLAWGTRARSGGATPSWNGTTCANYCHGQTLAAGGSNTTPSWTAGASQVTCGTCHGAPPPSHSPTSTSCGSCHPGYTATTVNLATHVNGQLDVSLSCTSCHGDATRTSNAPAPPKGTHGETATTTRAVGAHQAHLAAGPLSNAIACTECHVVPTSTSHSNGTVDLAWGTLARSGGATPSWNGTTCANYCHGQTLNAGGTNKAPSWTGGSAQAGCGTCHGAPPPPPHSTSTDCGTCHPGYTSTSVNVATHINGTIEASGGHPAGWADKTQHGYTVTSQGLASCKTCHGTSLDGVGGTGPSCATCHAAAGIASWWSNCTFCHGDRASGRASPPVDTHGGTSSANVSVGVHASHVGTTLAAPIACAQCHPDRTGSNVITDPAHIDGDGIAEVAFGALARTGGVSPTYTRTSGTAASCAATYCHGNFTGGPKATMSWTSSTQVTCTSCHGLPPSTGHHGNHSSRDCGDCHPGYTRSSVNQATHVNGTKQVGNRITSWNASTRQCVGCHGSATW